jgi:hypothetical protein
MINSEIIITLDESVISVILPENVTKITHTVLE